jgi:hypothetical protein
MIGLCCWQAGRTQSCGIMHLNTSPFLHVFIRLRQDTLQLAAGSFIFSAMILPTFSIDLYRPQ